MLAENLYYSLFSSHSLNVKPQTSISLIVKSHQRPNPLHFLFVSMFIPFLLREILKPSLSVSEMHAFSLLNGSRIADNSCYPNDGPLSFPHLIASNELLLGKDLRAVKLKRIALSSIFYSSDDDHIAFVKPPMQSPSLI